MSLSFGDITRVEASALEGQVVPGTATLKYPTLSSSDEPQVRLMSFLQRVARAALDVPELGESSWDMGPFKAIDDYTTYSASDWTVTTTEGGSGTASESVQTAAHGVLKILNDDADDDVDNLQKAQPLVKLSSGKPLYFAARFKVDDADKAAVFVGLTVTDTDILDTGWQDGAAFTKEADAGDAVLDFVSDKDGTASTVSGVHTLADGTWVIVGFFFDGDGTITPYVNGVAQTAVTSNICDDEFLQLSLAVMNDEGAAHSLSMDKTVIIQERA